MGLRLFRVIVDSNIYRDREFFFASERNLTVDQLQSKFSQGEVNSCTELGEFNWDAAKQDGYRKMYDIPSGSSIGSI